MDLLEELRTLIENLRREQIPYALCGGLALAVYGITRATEDIDLLVPDSSLPKLRPLAARLGYRFDPEPVVLRDGGVKIYRMFKTSGEDLLNLDLLMVTPLTESAWNGHREVQSDFGQIRVVSPEGLIALKSLRRSGQDEDDIKKLQQWADES